MKKHYYNIIVGSFSLGIIILSHFFFELSLWFILPILLLHFTILIYGVVNLDYNYFLFSHHSGDKKKRQIALTFDDGPTEQSKELLAVLKEANAKASFFCIGKNCIKNPAILKQIATDGHVIGNHSFSHSNYFDFYPSTKVLEELKQANQAIEKVIGKKPLLFRPPNGVTNPMIAKALKQTKLKSIAWNIRTFDTQIKDVDQIYSSVTSKIKPGSIVLMHDSQPHTTKLVLKLLKYCKENQYDVVGIDQLLNIKAYE